jgi:hypothetical protein
MDGYVLDLGAGSDWLGCKLARTHGPDCHALRRLRRREAAAGVAETGAFATFALVVGRSALFLPAMGE